MSENIMLYANQLHPSKRHQEEDFRPAVRNSQPLAKSGSQTCPETSPAQPDRTVAGRRRKQPFLRRNTGLQKRLDLTQQRRYVPKGGFVKGETEQDSPPAVQPSIADRAQHSQNNPRALQLVLQAQQTAPVHQQDGQGPARASALVQESQPQRSMAAGTAYDQNAPEWNKSPGQDMTASTADPQEHASPDHEAEMDADSALVHFPSRLRTQQSMQAPPHKPLMLQSSFPAPKTSQHLHLPVQSQEPSPEGVHSIRSSHSHLQLSRSSLIAQHASQGWQLQQATEVCSKHVLQYSTGIS